MVRTAPDEKELLSRGALTRRGFLAGVPLLAARGAAAAPDLPTVDPREVGLNPEVIGQISRRMERFVADQKIGGAVTLVARGGRVVHLRPVGWADVGKRSRMRSDNLFWIASMTKSITAAAVMTLVDEGKLSLDEPVSSYIPEFKDARCGSGPPVRPITLRHLMSHTSGLAQPDRKATDGAVSLARYAVDLVKPSLVFQPGSAYEYGFGLTVAGRVVEIVAGRPFDKYVERRITAPLGMKDTTFAPQSAQRRRLVTTYKPDEDGAGMVAAYNPFVTSSPEIVRTTEPSGGLFSTATDMFRFYQMILNGGRYGDARILSPAAINEMTRSVDAGGKPVDYGLGWAIQPKRTGAAANSLSGFGHGGAFGTSGFIDPARGIVAVLMIQRVLFPQPGEIRDAFHSLIAQAIQTP